MKLKIGIITGLVHLAVCGFAYSEAIHLRENYQVIQRDANDRGAFIIEIPDKMASEDIFTVKITDETGGVKFKQELKADILGAMKKGILVENVPVGGPYKVEITSANLPIDDCRRLVFHRILVGDIWILAGQSNMYGSLPIEEPLGELPYLNMVNFEMINSDAHWCAAIPPIHRYDKMLNKAGMLKRQHPSATEEEIQKMIEDNVPGGGIGPGYFFARQLYKETGVPIGFLPYALGAALSGWDPSKKVQNRYDFVYTNTKKYAGRVKGILWYQGEQDAIFGDDNNIVNKPSLIYPVSTYGDEFKKFIEAMRRDFNSPEMVVILAQIHSHFAPTYYAHEGYDDKHVDQKKVSPNLKGGIGWEKMHEIQRLIPNDISNTHTVPTIDLNLADGLHLDYSSYKTLGHRMAYVAAPYVNKEIPKRTEIRLKSAKWLASEIIDSELETRIYMRQKGLGPFSGGAHIIVEFEGVTGKLTTSGSKPTGFVLKNKKTQKIEDWIFRVDFDDTRPNTAILSMSAAVPKNQVVLYYGAGPAPYVNIIDENNMSLPAFGPIEMSK